MSHLCQKLAMGFGLVLVLALLTGCPKRDDPDPTPKPDPGPGPTPKPDGFAPDDFEATLRWMALQVEPLRKADEQRNKLLADQRLGEAHAQFARLAGRKVNWRLIVGNITDTTVDLEGYNLGNYLPDGKKGFRPYSAFLSVSAWAASTPPRRLTPGGNWVVGVPEPVPPPQPFPPPDPLPGFIQPKPTEYFTPGLEIGKVISKARATRLAAGEKVLVSGKIAYCVVSGPYPDRGIALCIVEAKSPD